MTLGNGLLLKNDPPPDVEAAAENAGKCVGLRLPSITVSDPPPAILYGCQYAYREPTWGALASPDSRERTGLELFLTNGLSISATIPQTS